MGAASERRALLLEADDSYNPFLAVDVNEYLIGDFSTLTQKHRTSVIHLCQNDEDFDYSLIYEQIDDKVYEYAETNSEVVLEQFSDTDEDEYEEEEEEDDSYESLVYVDVQQHLQDNYEEMDDDELAYMTDLITYKFDYSSVYDQIDQIVSNYNDGQYDDELEENSEEQTSE
jgi:hypothetical protein